MILSIDTPDMPNWIDIFNGITSDFNEKVKEYEYNINNNDQIVTNNKKKIRSN